MGETSRVWMVLVVLACFAWLGACSCDQSALSTGTITADLPGKRLLFTTSPGTTPIRKTIKLSNTGKAPIALTAATLSGDGSARFRLLGEPSFPIEIAPGGAGISLAIELTPTSLKGAVARLLLSVSGASNVDQQGHFVVFLEHRVKQGALAISCAKGTDFGEVGPGKSRMKLCELRNVGAAPLRLLGVEYRASKGPTGLFRWVSPSLPLSLLPVSAGGKAITVQLQFRPKGTEQPHISGTFVLRTDLFQSPGSAPLELPVSGTISIPRLDFLVTHGPCKNPEDCHALHPRLSCRLITSLSEKTCVWTGPDPAVHFYSALRIPNGALRLFHAGSGHLEIHGIRLSHGDPAIFSVSRRGFERGMQPGDSRSVNLILTQAQSVEKTGTVEISSNDSKNPRVQVKVVANQPACRLRVSGLYWLYGVVRVDYNYADLHLAPMLENLGLKPCTIKRIAVIPATKADEGAIVYDGKVPLPHVLGVQKAGLALPFSFHGKSATGLYSATLVIESNDARRPVLKIPIVGEGRAHQRCLDVSGIGRLSFPAGPKGCFPGPRTITIAHTGGEACGPIQIKSARLDGALFSLKSKNTLPNTLRANQSISFRLLYTGDYSGYKTQLSELRIETSHPAQPHFLATIALKIPGRSVYTEPHQLPLSPDEKIPTRFPLHHRPPTRAHMTTLFVHIDEKTYLERPKTKDFPGTFIYDMAKNEIVFLQKSLLYRGAKVRIYYEILCLPEGMSPP